VQVRGFFSIRNATGICHVNCRSTAEQVLIEECRGYDYYMVGAGTHTLSNSVILASADRSVVVEGGKTGKTCGVTMSQVMVVNRRATPAPLTIEPRGVFEGRRLTLYGVGIVASGESVAVLDSVVGGEPRPTITVSTNTLWRFEGSLYDAQ
jgi:hypothetical protein